MKNKVLSGLTVLCIILTLIPTTALAKETETMYVDKAEVSTESGEPELEFNTQEDEMETDAAPPPQSDLVAYPVEGGNIYFNPVKEFVVDCDESVTSAIIPSSINGVPVTKIGGFDNCRSLRNVSISNSVTYIEASAFVGCTALTSISIPDSVTYIGSHAFQGCTNLTSVRLSNNITTIERRLFGECTSLSSINIPDSVTSIEGFAFRGCTSLTSISISNRVTRIEEYAFSDCAGLKSIVIPDSVTNIGKHAFIFCSGLTSIKLSNRLVSIEEAPFLSCSNLTKIDIPSSVLKIGIDSKDADNVFGECSRLSAINVDANNPNYASIDGVLYDKSISTLLLYPAGKGNLVFSVPHGVTTIGKQAFNPPIKEDNSVGALFFTSISIPNSVTTIGERAFNYCTKLKDVYYSGSQTQWNKINIGAENNPLLSANIHCAISEASDHSVTYVLDGGTGDVPAKGYLSGQTVTVTKNVPTKDGYDFSGWSDGTTTYQPGDTFVMPEHDMTLTAVWTLAASDHSVTYVLDSGTGDVPAKGYLRGQTVTVTKNVQTKDGYTFAGWSDGKTTYQPGDTFVMPEHDVTLTAVWKEFIGPPLPVYTVTYQLDGGAGDIPAESHKLNETVTVTTQKPQKDRYVFVGWTDGTTTYQSGGTFEMPNCDVVLTAKWMLSIDEDNVFLKQPDGSKTCTLVTATMMVRRRAILDGIDDWESITEEAMKKVAWCKAGFIEKFTYRGMTGATDSTRGMSLEQKKDYLISMLQKHPEMAI